MLLNKVTTGFVIQTFDTEKNEYISQAFFAGDDSHIEYTDGTPANEDDKQLLENNYLPFYMLDPAFIDTLE
jgi:hypothetical protein